MKNIEDNDPEQIQLRLKEVIEHHIALGVEAIFSGVFMGNSPKNGSFHHLLCRCLMLAQAPITFLIFIQKGEEFKEVYRTNQHKNQEHQNTIQKRSLECRKSPKEYLMPLWINEDLYEKEYKNGTFHRYHLAVLTADTFDFKPLKRIEKFEGIDLIWDAIAYKIEKIFEAKKYESYGKEFHSYLNDSITNLIREQKDEPNKAIVVDQELRSDFYKYLQENTTAYEVIGTSVLDRVFSKLNSAIKAISMQDEDAGIDSLTNFFFYVRDYDDVYLKGKPRYGEYAYNIRFLIGLTQKMSLIKYFNTWKNVDVQKTLKKTLDEQIKAFNEDIQQFAASLFTALMEKVSTKDGCEDLTKILSKEFGQHTRSIADPVFDGVSFYRAPFDNDLGIGRSFPKGEQPKGLFSDIKDNSKKEDLLRVITFFFLLDAMATKDDGGKNNSKNNMRLRVMLNPIDVGGRTWAVAGYATRSFNCEDKITNSLDKIDRYNKFWLQNYHVCNDVNERMKKNLRTYMNRLYEDTIAKEYVKWIGKMAVEIKKDGANKKATDKALDLQKEIEYFNQRLKSLTCLFPYDMVKIKVEYTSEPFPKPQSNGITSKKQAFFVKNFSVNPEVERRSFFPNAPGDVGTRNFVDPMDIAIAMTDGVLRTVLDMNQNDPKNLN